MYSDITKASNELQGRYVPIQPDFERYSEEYKNVIITPGNRLWNCVSEFYEIPCSLYTDNCLHSIPDACVDMMFAIFEDCVKCYFLIGLVSLKNLYFYNVKAIFGARLLPGVAYPLIKSSINQILDVPVNFDDIFSNSNLCSTIYENTGFYNRVEIVTAFLLSHIKDDFENKHLLNTCYDYIVSSRGKVKIEDVANYTNYSDRYLRKKINEMIGVSPKTFASIVRLQNVFFLSNSRNCTLTMNDISIISGYTDLSHLNKELKKYVGLSSLETKAQNLLNISLGSRFEF